ncbi:hypothetical protein SAMN05216188_106304 [Lentzea xinjiangensis]|uniref:Uncharacterized protein n=1 Tax=Lentzea xinjiangensis TaxID=402600 RepID=A0A1H9K5Y6_9PSEU|nr:hypothetical protein [Lentzea xinjiangensis]SEQ94327.1 hypothetical protein SAMN05216188_106304 [Lentzea xinjiangensis]
MKERVVAQDVLDVYAIEQPELPHPPDDFGVVPKWTVEEVPRRLLNPLYQDVEPEIIDFPPGEEGPGYQVCPDETLDILWFTPTTLALTDFALTVRREVRPDGGIATTGGSAVISVSVYVGQPLVQQVVRERWKWQDQLLTPEAGRAPLTVLPAVLHGLVVDVELPAGVAAAPAIITASPLAGTATIAVELTEAGVLAWRTALEQGAGRTIAGTIRASASIPTVDPDNWYPGVDHHRLDTPLGSLLAARGPADIRQIDPQQTVSPTVVLVGSQLVTSSTVTLRPSGGQAPSSAVFGPAGGRITTAVVTQDPDTVAVEWRAEVAFTPARWPVVPASGRLDSAHGWITMIKPEAWCVGYVLAIVPVDQAGRPVPASTRAGDRVQGVLNFTAPYVAGGLLSTAFDAEYGRPESLVLPRYPDQPFGDLVLTVFATCGGVLGQASRRLGEDDVVVTALAHPDGEVELHTTAESLPETASGLSKLLTRLGDLARG